MLQRVFSLMEIKKTSTAQDTQLPTFCQAKAINIQNVCLQFLVHYTFYILRSFLAALQGTRLFEALLGYTFVETVKLALVIRGCYA